MLTAADKEVRRERIGASEAATVLGISPYGGPFDVFARIAYGIQREETPAMVAGRYLESAVIDWYADKTSHDVWPAVSKAHPMHDWLSATPDRLFTADAYTGVVEAKVMRSRDDWGEDESDQVPAHIACQAQIQMAVTGENRCDVPVFFSSSSEFGLYVLHRDDAVIDYLITQLGAWYQRHIIEGVPPDLDGGSAAAEYLRRRYPTNDGTMVEATPEQEAMVRVYAELKDKIGALEGDCDVVRQRLIEAIADRDGFLLRDGGRVTYRADKRAKRSLRLSGLKGI